MASLMRRISSLRYPLMNQLYRNDRRTMKNWEHLARMEFKRRKEREKPDPAIDHRSNYTDWNYKSELFAFSKRLNENLSEEVLREAFVHQSYIDREEQKRMELRLPKEEIALDIKNNEGLAAMGEALMSEYIMRYLRYVCPYFPEEGIRAVHDHLMSEDVLSHVAANIGTKDLILCGDIFPDKPTLAVTIKAVIGAILKESKEQQAELFVQDFVLTQLVGKDLAEMWQPFNPMGILKNILEREKRALPESRLIGEAGRKTLVSVFVVGIYSNKEFLGMGSGDTLDAAEEMAARDSLKRMFQLKEHRNPLPFGTKGHKLQLISKIANLGVSKWTSQDAKSRFNVQKELQ